MGKYNQYRQDASFNPGRKSLHPIWRGIGFVLMIVVPILSYYAMLWVLRANTTTHWFTVPAFMISRWGDPLIFVKIFLTLLIVIVFYAVILAISFLLNSLFGSPRYGPTDAPPV